MNNKKVLTPQEQQERDALNRKDLESDLAYLQACQGSGGGCEKEKGKAKEALNTYINQTYQNPKEAQAGYQQIQNLLKSTDPNAKEVFNVLEGYTQAFMTFGYTEEEAKARVGAYVGAMYVSDGVSAVVASGALVKQFGKDVVVNGSNRKGSLIDGASNVNSTAKVKVEYKPEGTYINQTSHPTGGSNLCGPTSCAMVISDNKGNIVNLDSVVQQFDNIRPIGVNVHEMNGVLIKNGLSSESTLTLTANQLRALSTQNK